MIHIRVFSDGSVNTQLKIGYGAFLILSELNTPLESLKNKIEFKRFEQTSSTKLELQTLLWAMNEAIALANGSDLALTVYTDSKNIIGLPARRTRLEKNNYVSAKGKRLNNDELYQDFFRLCSDLNIELVKVIGHQPTSQKGEIDRIFNLVDQASRRALREEF